MCLTWTIKITWKNPYLQTSLNLWPAKPIVWNSMQCDGMRRTNHCCDWLWCHKIKEWYCACCESDIHCENREVIIIYVLLDTQFSINLFQWHQGNILLPIRYNSFSPRGEGEWGRGRGKASLFKHLTIRASISPIGLLVPASQDQGNGEQHFILNSLIFTNRIVISSSKTQDSYGIFKQFVQNRIILNTSRLIKFIA